MSIRAATGLTASELVGWVQAVDTEGVQLRDRRGEDHHLSWAQISAWRSVGVPRGRDPLRTSTAELDPLAKQAGVSGRKFVIRLSQLLDGREPSPSESGSGVAVAGEWATISGAMDVLPAAWWAARADARSLQVRTDDSDRAAELIGLGFVEVG